MSKEDAEFFAEFAMPSLIGRFVHVIVDRKVDRQGAIIGQTGEYIVVAWFSWIDGTPTSVEPLHLGAMSLRIYRSSDEMRKAYEWIGRKTDGV
jgi:hypothetical protein